MPERNDKLEPDRKHGGRRKTLGQIQSGLPPDVDRDVPPGGGIGQMGEPNPDRPTNQDVNQPTPGRH